MDTILIVDDEPIYHERVENILRQKIGCHNLHFLHAYNGMDGLTLFIKNKSRIKSVLLDIEMPVLDGWQFLNLLLGKYHSEGLNGHRIVIFSSALVERKIENLKKDFHNTLDLLYCHKNGENLINDLCEVFN